MEGKPFLRSEFLHALQAVEPAALVYSHLKLEESRLLVAGKTTYELDPYDEIRLFASGKAAVPMARAAMDIMGSYINGGVIIAPEPADIPGLHVLQGDHPIPTQRSLDAAAALKQELEAMGENTLFIYLLSGGSSALMELPAEGLSLEDINTAGRVMLESALPIESVNCIRKHLSAVKGGRLGAATRAKGIVLVLSDVIGDDLETIGSAPLFCDRSSFAQARALVETYGMQTKLPPAVLKHLEEGERGTIPETPDTPSSLLPHYLIGSNRIALESIAAHIQDSALKIEIVTDRLSGEASEVARDLVQNAKKLQSENTKFPCLLIYGGETTVNVKGNGMGGRNQELALAALIELGDHPGITLLSGATDGIDGNSDAAGGVIDAGSFRLAAEQGISLQAYLNDNDSYHALKALGDLIVTGYTGTNVMDIIMVQIRDPKTTELN